MATVRSQVLTITLHLFMEAMSSIYILTLYAFLEMSQINTERKDIHKTLVIFRLFTNLLRTQDALLKCSMLSINNEEIDTYIRVISYSDFPVKFKVSSFTVQPLACTY